MRNRTANQPRRAAFGLGPWAGASLSLLLTVGCAPSSKDAAGRGKWGARAGVLVPGAALESYSSSLAVGAFYRGHIPAAYGPRETPFEIGLDVWSSESDDGRVETIFYAVHSGVLLFRGASAPASGLYFLGGYTALLASSKVDGRSGYNEWNLALDVGLGAASTATGWDVRLAYSSLLASRNLKDFLLLTAGYRF